MISHRYVHPRRRRTSRQEELSRDRKKRCEQICLKSDFLFCLQWRICRKPQQGNHNPATRNLHRSNHDLRNFLRNSRITRKFISGTEHISTSTLTAIPVRTTPVAWQLASGATRCSVSKWARARYTCPDAPWPTEEQKKSEANKCHVWHAQLARTTRASCIALTCVIFAWISTTWHKNLQLTATLLIY